MPIPVGALPVQDLYVAEVLVASRAQSELTQGARAGLLQVLVRVSGTTEVESNPLVTAALRNPADYYYQYGFDSTDRTLMVDGNEVQARLLRISFDPSAVSRLLRQAGFPVWGSNRPGILVWLAYNEGDGRQMLTEADTSQVMQSFKSQARYRGLPLMYPLMDLEDSIRLSTAEVWGLFLDRVESASIRYSPDSVVTGRVQQDASGQWSGRWYYRIESRWKGLDNLASSADELVAGMVSVLADELATRYAVGSAEGSIILRVESVNDLADYAAVSAYLESLTPVVESFVLEVQGDEVLFKLNTEGEATQLMETINLDDKMLLMNAGDGSSRSNPLHFRWMGNR
ncbi:MAG: DUF2066 domain-containing protein [Pseudomonadales bacterium]